MTTPLSADTEELRLTIAHLRTEIQSVILFARNSINTNSTDVEDWRADMQQVVTKLETRLEI